MNGGSGSQTNSVIPTPRNPPAARASTGRGRRLLLLAVGALLALSMGLVVPPTPASAYTTIVLYVSCGRDGFYHISGDGAGEYIDGPCGGPRLTTAGDTTVKLVVGGRTEMSAAGRSFLNRLDSGDIRIGTLRRIPGSRARALPARPGTTQSIYVASSDVGPGLSALLTKIDPNWARQPNR